MPRRLCKFHGDALIVGGGWIKSEFQQPLFRHPKHFYTIDIDINAQPDLCLDITDQEACERRLPAARFSFIYFEHFPFTSAEQLITAFTNSYRLLKEDGVLIYRGGAYESIPELLIRAGFAPDKTFRKRINEDRIEHYPNTHNGIISLTSKSGFSLSRNQRLPINNATQFYIQYYQFDRSTLFYNEPLSQQILMQYSRPVRAPLEATPDHRNSR